MCGVRRVDAVDDRLEVALDDRQRRPKLVADLGQQGPPLAFVGLEPGGHGVEARDELADGAKAAWLRSDAHRVIAPLDRAGCLDELVQGRGRRPEPAADPDQDRGDGDQHDESGQPSEVREDESGRRNERPGDEQEDEPENAAEAAATAPATAFGPRRWATTLPGTPARLVRVEPVGSRIVGSRPGRGHQSAARSSANR